MNRSKTKETRTYYNYKKIGHISSNYRQKKSVKTKGKAGKRNSKKLKFTPKRELAVMIKRTNKQINRIFELSNNNKKRFKQIAGLPENLEYCNRL